MKKKRPGIIISIILIAVLSVFLLIQYITNSKGTLDKELRDFAVEDTASIIRIFMVGKDGEHIDLKRVKGHWLVNDGYDARQDAITTLLKTIKRVAVMAPVSKASHNTNVKNLAVSSTKVEIYTGDGLVKVYYVGGATKDHNGTIMLLEGSSVPFIMHIPGFNGYLSTRYFLDEILWRSQAVFHYRFSDIASVTVEYPAEPAKSYKVIQLGLNQYRVEELASGKILETIDTVSIKFYLAGFKKVNYDCLLADMKKEKKDSILAVVPKNIITVEDQLKRTNSIRTYLRRIDDVPDVDSALKAEFEFDVDKFYGATANDDILLLQYFIFDPLVKDVDYFRK